MATYHKDFVPSSTMLIQDGRFLAEIISDGETRLGRVFRWNGKVWWLDGQSYEVSLATQQQKDAARVQVGL